MHTKGPPDWAQQDPLTLVMRCGDYLVLALAVVAGLVLVALTLLTFVDVGLRYVFARPIPGAQDVQAVAMIIVLFLALPLVTRMDGHIVVDLVPVPQVLVRGWQVGVRAIILVVFVVLAWQSTRRAIDAAVLGEATNMLEIPLRPFFFILATGCAVNVIILALEIVVLSAGRPVVPLHLDDNAPE